MFTETVLAKRTSSISEFKKTPSAAMSESHGEPVAVLSHNKPAFYCVPPALFALMMDQIGDQLLLDKAMSRLDDDEVEVTLDQL